jgi:exopolyphosphatase/guanosine-5'-triphosphate,3'-diphosphate pyrophosphatase
MIDIGIYLSDEDIYELLIKYDSSRRMSHLQKVRGYTNILINILIEEDNKLNSIDKNLLKYGSLLHDIGYFINKESHHKHSKYIILTDSFFDKLPSSQRNILALLVASHRKNLDKEINYYPRREQEKIIQLIAILRLADALDYGENNIIQEAYVEDKLLYFKSKEYPNEKEIKKFSTKSQLFKDTFNLDIVFI